MLVLKFCKIVSPGHKVIPFNVIPFNVFTVKLQKKQQKLEQINHNYIIMHLTRLLLYQQFLVVFMRCGGSDIKKM